VPKLIIFAESHFLFFGTVKPMELFKWDYVL